MSAVLIAAAHDPLLLRMAMCVVMSFATSEVSKQRPQAISEERRRGERAEPLYLNKMKCSPAGLVIRRVWGDEGRGGR